MDEMERFKAAWQQQADRQGPGTPGPALAASLRARVAWVHRTVAWRDGLETGSAIAGIILVASLLPVFHGTLTRAGGGVTIAGLVLIMVKLRRARPREEAQPRDLTVREFCAAEIANVDAQMTLLRSVLWWYVGPVVVGVNMFFVGVRGASVASLVYLVATLVLAAFICAVNARAARLKLKPIRDQLARIVEQLGAEEPDERRHDG